jgi:hypothetical protein
VKVKVVWRTSLQNQEVKFTFFVLHPSPLASHLFLIGPWILAIKNTMGLCLPFHFQAYCWFLFPLIFLFHFPKNTTRPRVVFVKSFLTLPTTLHGHLEERLEICLPKPTLESLSCIKLSREYS